MSRARVAEARRSRLESIEAIVVDYGGARAKGNAARLANYDRMLSSIPADALASVVDRVMARWTGAFPPPAGEFLKHWSEDVERRQRERMARSSDRYGSNLRPGGALADGTRLLSVREANDELARMERDHPEAFGALEPGDVGESRGSFMRRKLVHDAHRLYVAALRHLIAKHDPSSTLDPARTSSQLGLGGFAFDDPGEPI